MFGLFKKKETAASTLPYLEKLEVLDKVEIYRLKGRITREMVPIIEARIAENRKKGSKIDRNVIADFAKVEDVDSATVAFHMMHLEEYHQKGFQIGLINIDNEMKGMLELLPGAKKIRVFASEAEALKELNK